MRGNIIVTTLIVAGILCAWFLACALLTAVNWSRDERAAAAEYAARKRKHPSVQQPVWTTTTTTTYHYKPVDGDPEWAEFVAHH